MVRMRTKLILGFVGVSGALIGGGSYATYQRRLKENKAISAVDFNAKQDAEQRERAFANLMKKNDEAPKVTMFRYTTCPFCGKVKAFLDYYKIPHELVEVEPMFKSEIGTMEYKKVPQLRFVNDAAAKPVMLVDSDLIVDTLAPIVGAAKQLKDPSVEKWRDWARSSLVKLLVVNINGTLRDSWGGYEYIDQFDTIPYKNKLFLKVMGAPVMYLVSRYKTMPTLLQQGILKPDDDVREVLRLELDRFADTGVKPGQFHGGAKPDIADLDVYGVLQSLRGHKVYNEVILGSHLKDWVVRMDVQVGATKAEAGANRA